MVQRMTWCDKFSFSCRNESSFEYTQVGPSYTPGFLKQIFFVHSFRKNQKVVTLQSNQKGPGHKQIMKIQRPPEVASKTTYTPGFLKQIFFVHSFRKNQKVVTLQSNQKGSGHKQIMKIQRPPEVASKTNSPVRKEARWTISPENMIGEENSPVNILS